MQNRIHRTTAVSRKSRDRKPIAWLAGLLGSLALVSAAVAAPNAYKTVWGPYAVQVIDNHMLPAEPGQRSLRARIAYPDADGPFPLVVYSHGFNCYRESYSGLTDHWASHGYVVVLPEHPDCPTAEARMTPEDIRNLLYIRISDVGRVLEALFAQDQEIPGLSGRIDFERKAVAGHSFGGMIAQVVWGQPLKDLHSAERVSYALGFDAAIVMSGVGEMPPMADGSFNEIPGPVMVTGGTLDLGNIGGPTIYPWEWRMAAYSLSPPGRKYSVVLEEGDHYLGGLICRDDRGGPDNRGGAHDDEGLTILAGATTAFLDAWVKNDRDARRFLEDFEQRAALTDGRARFAQK
ncbi:alpha/beta hydrolase family protein [Candidatus Foliamicus sp.]